MLVAPNARQQCFNGDGSVLAYLKGESESFTYTDYATVGVFFFDLASGSHREHPNRDLHHLYNPCWTCDGQWLLATVHAGMGYRHAILAIEADGQNVYNLEIPGCRPDVSPDGTMIAWGASDWVLCVGELDFGGVKPAVKNIREIVKSERPMEVYHIDWSPDGKYVAFSRGPAGRRMGRIPEVVGVEADGWNICVADSTATNRWVQLTTDGNCNKEPDWIPHRGDE
jgi:Tol biopolymer transport system component